MTAKEVTESQENRDRRIRALKRRGLSVREIAVQVDMSPSGVQHALARMYKGRSW